MGSTLSNHASRDYSRIQPLIDEILQRNADLHISIDGLQRTFSAIVEAFRKGGILYLAGNGGSFADAVHIKGELAKSFVAKRPLNNPQVIEKLQQSGPTGEILLRQIEEGLPVVVLGESHSVRSAFANDQNPDLIYAQELNSFAAHIPHGVFMGISTSGNAKNVIAAAVLAKAYGLHVVGFTGPKGGKLSEMADIHWKSPGEKTHLIQENQIILYHTLCIMLEEFFYPDAKSQ